jgi:hypothetical protein
MKKFSAAYRLTNRYRQEGGASHPRGSNAPRSDQTQKFSVTGEQSKVAALAANITAKTIKAIGQTP